MHVDLKISDTLYRLFCEKEEEHYIRMLADLFNQKMDELQEMFPQLDSRRLEIMSALSFVDDTQKFKKQLLNKEEEITTLKLGHNQEKDDWQKKQLELTQALEKVTERIEDLTEFLEKAKILP